MLVPLAVLKVYYLSLESGRCPDRYTGVSWSNVPNDVGNDEPIIACLDGLRADTWYDSDVTAAVRDALENAALLRGSRIAPDADNLDAYCGSRERDAHRRTPRWRR